MITGRLGSDTQAALRRFANRARREIGLSGEVTVLLAGNDDMRKLNRKFRKKDKPTDVLSFPAASASNGHGVGDIAISTDIAREQAGYLGHTLEQELKILLLHGLLHLAGYDHERDRGEMFRVERRFRLKLGLPSSLVERSTERKRRAR
jgi:probable rRNA maturation factor